MQYVFSGISPHFHHITQVHCSTSVATIATRKKKRIETYFFFAAIFIIFEEMTITDLLSFAKQFKNQ